jgi:hypothetical protein
VHRAGPRMVTITWLRRRGSLQIVFDAFLGVQALHLGEHLAQIAQIYLWGWPPALARGVVASLDVEKVHAVWNLGVLIALAWLLRRAPRSGWLVATFAWATLHTIEHAYLVTGALLSGLESQPGILGLNGLLARSGIDIPGITAWTRPTVHLAWNAVEVALLLAAYIVTWGASKGPPGAPALGSAPAEPWRSSITGPITLAPGRHDRRR